MDSILEDDEQRPRKQRHTARRIFKRLRAEHGGTDSYTIVREYVREKNLRGQEMFLPLIMEKNQGTAWAQFGRQSISRF